MITTVLILISRGLRVMHGAALSDPDHIFNAGLEGNQRRSIDIFEGDQIDKDALHTLVLTAISFNQAKL